MGISRNDTGNKLKFFSNIKKEILLVFMIEHCPSCSPNVYNTKPANPLGECRKLGGNLIIFYLQKESIWQYLSSSIQSQM